MAPSSASRSPRQPDGDGTDRPHVAVAGLDAEAPHLLDDAGGVGDRVRVGHRVDGGEATDRGRAGCRTRRSRRPRGPARAGAVCRSTSPGRAIRPVASTTWAPPR